MSSFVELLQQRFTDAVGVDPELRAATKPQFGHFQTSVALRLAKSQGRPPREVAQGIIGAVDVSDLCEPLEVAGPGFINVRLRPRTIADAVSAHLADPRHGVPQVEHPQRVVIDYSSPNVAKQMHVGHLRSTIIGDAFHRVLRAVGHTVIAQNHVGDWGTQFGMLVEQILSEGIDASALTLDEADSLYKRANARFGADEEFATQARQRVVALQAGDAQTRAIWEQLIIVSEVGFNEAYARLDVLLTDTDLAGESTYNDDLPVVVAELESSGAAVVDQGALCIFTEGYAAPLIIRKSDGGYGYGTTDLAAVRRRVGPLSADRIIYVTDVRQAGHFGQVFAAARQAGYLPDRVSTQHVGYGMVLGTDGRPFKTREGKAMPLTQMLDAAEQQVTRPIALAAIKYADLSNGLNRDYVFDLDRMVATTGDTGPYLQYAHARICQMLRRADAEQIEIGATVHELTDEAEQALALVIVRFAEVVLEVADTLQPHRLCHYLYELAGAVARFYDACPVLRSEGTVRASRLALCVAARQVLAEGLEMLGIEAPERM